MSRIALAFTPLLLAVVGLTGCGGSKVLKSTQPIEITQSLASATDQCVVAAVDWVIVRNRPGSWAKNADWDEYLIGIRNVTDEAIQVTDVAVYNSLGDKGPPLSDRRLLVAASKLTTRRYRGSGLKIRAGIGGPGLAASGLAVTAASAGLGIAALTGDVGVGAAGAAVGGMLIVGPALVIGGVVRGVHDSKVNKEIGRRHTVLPVYLAARTDKRLDVFFPLAPSPSRLEITYSDAQGVHRFDIDTRQALAGLHLEAQNNPKEASNATRDKNPQ